ncbi:MAG: hypothetical protein QHI38_05910 [Armatimonadota bacterium]|nr:hypothetical protein [Armatimonadota bacterium]
MNEGSAHTYSGQAAAVRLRAYLVGIVAVVGVCFIVAFSELIASRGGSIDAILLGATHMPPGAICVLIVLLLANALVRRISRRLGLSSAELGVIYFMLVCAALISSFGLMTQLLPNLIGINYFANPQDHLWRDLFYKHIPAWLVPWDPDGPERQWVSVRFYEGLRVGERIPWNLWVKPLLAWLVFAFLLFFMMACIATLFRRQWVDNEKLTFPLVQLPMELVNEESSKSFVRSKAMWMGFAIPVVIHSMNGLHRSIPSVPQLPTWLVLNQFFVTKPWNEMIVTFLVLSFSIIGFAYLLPLDVSFSMWFFLLFFRLQDFVALCLGYHLDQAPLYGGTRFYQAYQSTGAFVAITISLFWLARPHLRLVAERVRSAIGPASERAVCSQNGGLPIDADEYMTYRTAVFGAVIAFLLMLVWLKAAGLNPLVAAFMVGSFVLIVMLVLTRFVAEVGLLMLQPVFRPLDLWAVAAPKAALGVQNLTIIAFLNGIFMRDPRNVMPAFLDSMKGVDLVKARRRSVGLGVLAAIVVAALTASVIQLRIIYGYGGLRLNSWFFMANPRLYFDESAGILLRKTAYFDHRAPLWFAVGLVFTFFLYAMRARFWWWPFHPLGYAIGCAWPAVVYWSSFFVGWLAKSLILRYGGATTYRSFRPFFLGLILGEFTTGIIWALLSGLLGVASPAIPIS